MKRFPEKMIMAGIILSCGFAMHADPSSSRTRHKSTAEAHKLQLLRQAEASARHLKAANHLALREDRGSW